MARSGRWLLVVAALSFGAVGVAFSLRSGRRVPVDLLEPGLSAEAALYVMRVPPSLGLWEAARGMIEGPELDRLVTAASDIEDGSERDAWLAALRPADGSAPETRRADD